jgi:hypothetical protein
MLIPKSPTDGDKSSMMLISPYRQSDVRKAHSQSGDYSLDGTGGLKSKARSFAW